MVVTTRAVPNIPFVFTSVPNIGPNSLFIFGQIVMLDRIRTVKSCASHARGGLAHRETGKFPGGPPNQRTCTFKLVDIFLHF